MVHINGLSGTTNHIMRQSIACHAADDLVLPRHVQLVEHFVQLLFHFELVGLKLFYFGVFLSVKKLEGGGFGLRLAKGGFPAEFNSVECLFSLDQLQMQRVVFLDKALIFMLER